MKLHPPQHVPGLQQLLLFLSRGAPCIPVEMGLNPLDQKVLPAFAAITKPTPASNWDSSPF